MIKNIAKQILSKERAKKGGGQAAKKPKPSAAMNLCGIKTDEFCVLCSAKVRFGLASWHKNAKRVAYFHECTQCGFVQVLNNDWNYAKTGFATEGSTVGPRVGQRHHRGREFHMATLGSSVLGRSDLNVLILGSGKSQDWRHISALPEVGQVTTSDLENFNDSPNFIPFDKRGGQQYDLVLACEVAEHFANPRADFASLCGDTNESGLAILSTNIYDGTDLSRHWYVFIPGHVAYYTPEAFMHLAKCNDMEVDFRLPAIVNTVGGPRKRYVLLSRSSEILQRIPDFFAVNTYAPSETIGS